MFEQVLSHPRTRGLNLDDPLTTSLRRQIIRENTFLERIYAEWYAFIASALPSGESPVLELGSGGGFFGEQCPGVITSDAIYLRNVQAVLDGRKLPFKPGSLRGIVMTNVFHHLCNPRDFFKESSRCLRSNGVIVMIEPWSTEWSRWIYTRFHHEPFVHKAEKWDFAATGPLSGANGALPWIVFRRDRRQFEWEFPNLKIEKLELKMPFRYLLSGGVSRKNLMPGFTFDFWRKFEELLAPFYGELAMFAGIVLRKSG